MITDWLTAIGTIGATIVALGLGIWNVKELRREQSTGLSLRSIDQFGNGIIENDSKIDYVIELSKAVLCGGVVETKMAQKFLKKYYQIFPSMISDKRFYEDLWVNLKIYSQNRHYALVKIQTSIFRP